MADEQLKKLNKSQEQAVLHESGPLLIVAGAGTGKTTVLTERIKHLIEKRGVDPHHIFATTFTEKAAEEMLARLDTVMPLGYQEPWMGTFHGLCDRILRIEGLEIGLNPNFTLMTQTDQWLFIRQHLFDFDLKYYRPLGNPARFIGALMKFFSRLTDEDVGVDEVIQAAAKKAKAASAEDEQMEAERQQELAGAYQKYIELKHEFDKLDFGDLITLTLRLLRDRPNLSKKYQDQFEHVLVDEFQDTNYAQFELIKLFAPPETNPNLVVVGDDDQCLPPVAEIITPEGVKPIKDIRRGDQVLSGVGKGYTSFAKVTHVMKTKKAARFLTINTKSGAQITLTDNHKVFCHVKRHAKEKLYYYVYLMRKNNKGWRIGITTDIASRIRLERHADYIIAVKACKTEAEARYYEALYSIKYGLPTTVFLARPDTVIKGDWLDKLMQEIDTDKGAAALAKDLHVDLNAPQVMADAIFRGDSKRIKINVYLCSRNYASKTDHDGFMPNPQIAHTIHLETTCPDIITALTSAGYHLTPAKKGMRLRYQSRNFQDVIQYAEKIQKITGGFIDEQTKLGRENIQSLMSRIIPATNLKEGMYIPVLKGRKLVLDQIVGITEVAKTETVYDLEVSPCHNFIADGIAVHNSIYKFRGASVANILTFKTVYPKAKEIVLTGNYRSTQQILDSSYQSIINNNPDRLETRLGIEKKLKAHLPDNPVDPPAVYHFAAIDEEVEWTVNKIYELVTKHNLTYQDIAVITRANSHLEPYVMALKNAGIPYQLITNRGLYDQDEIKTLLNILKVLADPHDSISLYQLLLSRSFALNSSELLDLMSRAHQTSTSLWQQLEASSVDKHQDAVKTLNLFRTQAADKTITQLVYIIIDKLEYIKQFTQTESLENQLKIKNLNLFFSQLKRFETISTDKSLIGFLSTFEMWSEAGENPAQAQIEDIDTVSLMTVHKAKGLEFEAVIVAGLVAGRFPSINRSDPIEVPVELIKEELPEGNEHLQEERRLFYVAITRAKKFLYLTFSEDVGGTRKRKMSGFCAETGLPIIDVTPPTDPLIKLTIPQPAVAQEIKQGKFIIDRISYSQINVFDSCPQKYKYRYLLRIPTPPHHSLSFGQTVHETLYEFHLAKLQGHNLSLADFEASYRRNFIEAGYESREHKQARFDAGLQAMRDYYAAHIGQLGKPIMLEQDFTLRLSTAVITGKIDRIDENGAGYEIVDYKTGSLKTQREVDKDEQLTMYVLAARAALNLPVSQASLYFIEHHGEKLTTLRTDEDINKATGQLEKKIQTMQNSDFPAKPDAVKCGFCEYYAICPAASKKMSV